MNRLLILMAIAVTAAACGGGDNAAPEAAAAPAVAPPAATAPTTAPQPTTTLPQAELVTTVQDIPYAGTQLLDVWTPTTPGPWPVLVMLHGWGGPDATNVRSGYGDLAEAIAGGGVVVYNIEWPVRDQFVEEAGIVACAVGFARATATDYGGSPDRVTVLGHSAGGSMATTVAFSADLLDPAADCAASGSSAPDALVGVAGDYAYAISGPAAGLKDGDPTAWEIIDPYSNIGSNPGLEVHLLHGTIDDWVDVQSAIDFEQALAAAGYDVHLTVLDGVGHNSLIAPTFDAFGVTVAMAVEVAHG